MKILSIDTSSEICSVAIVEDSKILYEVNLENGNTHSQNLMPLISKALSKTNLNIHDIDLFTCDNGPGSFTGIRIGIATLKAFRDVTLKPIIGVSSLKSLAYGVKDNTKNDIICSLIDAKNNNVYYGLFKFEDDNIFKIGNYNFSDITSLLKNEIFLNNKIFFVGNGSIVYKDVIQSVLENNATFCENDTKNKLNAVNIANVAVYKYSHQQSDFSNIVPLYLKKSNAEITLEEKNK